MKAKKWRPLAFTVILTLVEPQDKYNDFSIGRWYKREVNEDNPPILRLPGSCWHLGPSAEQTGLCVISCWIPLKPWHPDWQLFLSAHLRAGRLGNGGGGPGEVGSTPLARGPLGKHARCLPTQIALQKWKGSVQLRLESRLGNDSQLSTHHKTARAAGAGPLTQGGPHGLLYVSLRPSVCVPLWACFRGWHPQHAGRRPFQGDPRSWLSTKNPQSHTSLQEKSSLLFWMLFLIELSWWGSVAFCVEFGIMHLKRWGPMLVSYLTSCVALHQQLFLVLFSGTIKGTVVTAAGRREDWDISSFTYF